jgi:hypothetical protein
MKPTTLSSTGGLMKSLITALSFLFSLGTFAFEAQVISTHFKVANELQEKTLCLTILRVRNTGEFLGIVEDIHDCFYAREAKSNSHHWK